MDSAKVAQEKGVVQLRARGMGITFRKPGPWRDTLIYYKNGGHNSEILDPKRLCGAHRAKTNFGSVTSLWGARGGTADSDIKRKQLVASYKQQIFSKV